MKLTSYLWFCLPFDLNLCWWWASREWLASSCDCRQARGFDYASLYLIKWPWACAKQEDAESTFFPKELPFSRSHEIIDAENPSFFRRVEWATFFSRKLCFCVDWKYYTKVDNIIHHKVDANMVSVTTIRSPCETCVHKTSLSGCLFFSSPGGTMLVFIESFIESF